MELKLKNKFNESRIGIASSIACQFNFNWQKTLHFAKELNVSIIQLFLPPIALLKQYVNEIESEADNISELYFHLYVTGIQIPAWHTKAMQDAFHWSW